jgi:hypothetical protein
VARDDAVVVVGGCHRTAGRPGVLDLRPAQDVQEFAMNPDTKTGLITIAVFVIVTGGLIALGIWADAGKPEPVQWQPTGVASTDWACENGQLLYRYHNIIDGTYSITSRQDADRRCAQ